MIMFPFSYRTLEMTFNDFLRDNAWWIALAFAGLVLLSVALILLFNAKAKPKARVIEKSVYPLPRTEGFAHHAEDAGL